MRNDGSRSTWRYFSIVGWIVNDDSKDLIDEVFDPQRFRQYGHQLVDLLTSHLQGLRTEDPSNLPDVLNFVPPEELMTQWESISDWDQGNQTPEEVFERVLKHSIRLHHPSFIGHQISPAAPLAAISSLLIDLVNNGMGVYEMGMAGTCIENQIVNSVAQKLGFPDDAGGVFTSGGSLANLTALLAARSRCLEKLESEKRVCTKLGIMVSAQAHYCIARSAKIMGFDSSQVIPVLTNDRFQIETDELPKALASAREAGIEIMAVVGNACSTSTGSFDDLRAMGQFCRDRDLWFHVDGAHGAAMIYSEKYKYLLDGISLADSLAMDFHKLLLTPALCSAVIFANGSTAYQTFAQKADYLWGQTDEEWFNLAKRTFECTKNMMGLKVYMLLAVYGERLFNQSVTRVTDLAIDFANLLKSSNDFQLLVDPQTNIVCFRYVGLPQSRLRARSNQAIDAINSRIRMALVERGDHFIVQTVVQDSVWLRCTVSNPMTGNQQFKSLMDSIRNLANSVIS